MSAANQATVQAQLVSVLSAALAGTGKPFQAVYGYRPVTANGQSPVLFVVSDGEQRAQPWAGTPKYDNRFRFTLITCLSDTDNSATYDREDVEDAINDTQQAIAQVVADNRHTPAYWKALYLTEDFSSIEPVMLDNLPFWAIYRPVIVEVEDAA